jgi:shikimate 5-dehydrogenase
MARYDKYDGVTGGFRAVAAADVASVNDYDTVLGVGLDTTGKAVLKAASNSGFVGVTIVDRTKRKAGDVLDIMQDGEIVEVPGLIAGTFYYLTAGGLLTATGPGAGVNAVRVGHTVEATRLVVRLRPVQG